MNDFPVRNPNRCPTHPGAILRKFVFPALDMPTTTIAGHLGLSNYAIESLLAERRPMTAKLALRVGKLLGNGPDIWLNMQTAYDL